MKEKLTLEHLAAYLPYGLKVKTNYCMSIETLSMCNSEGAYLLYKYDLYSLNSFKPLLRPLSKLTEEIEHNGEKFVPIENFLNDIKISWNNIGLTYPNDEMGLYDDIINNIESCEYWMIKKLLEWHFDIFRLIDKGLAIEK